MNRLRLLAMAVLTAIAVTDTHANTAARAKAFAQLPDWSGIWQSAGWWPLNLAGRPVGGEARLKRSLQTIQPPPYNSKWEAIYEESLKNTEAIAERVKNFKACERTFPQLMEAPWLFQIAVLPEETLVVFDNGQVRHLYTDGRPHPSADESWPTPLGDSTGHWQGETLIVDTIGRIAEPLGPRAWFSVLSDRAHFTEKLRRTGPDDMEDELIIEDPETLARPWTMTLRFKRLPDMKRLIAGNCTENDRNPVIDGEMKLTVPQ